MGKNKTNVEPKLCTKIMDVIWERNKVFLEGLSEEEMMDVRIRDLEFAEQLAGIISSMITNRKWSELRKCRWSDNLEYRYDIRITATNLTSKLSDNVSR